MYDTRIMSDVQMKRVAVKHVVVVVVVVAAAAAAAAATAAAAAAAAAVVDVGSEHTTHLCDIDQR